MSKVYLGSITMPVAPLGRDNPLPPLAAPGLVTKPVDTSAADAEMARNLGYGRPPSLLPYTVQDGYTRDLEDREVRTAVVENELIRAEFLLDHGGRMWSLIDLTSGRELLHRNPILQPANLALRNAWFAGGVEWNLGTTGHTPLTCAPMHAARVVRPDGVPVLRMWEWERMRELVYQIDAYAPPGSPVLLVHVRIVNTNRHEVPVYWWSNIAVPETRDTRVLAPTDTAWHLDHTGVLRRVPVPGYDGRDPSYPGRIERAADYFYDISAWSDTERPWIAALDGSGSGLVQASTRRLRGRKLFLWGQSLGGQRWQQWLSPPGHPYLEIQAGLARTQLEHLPMPAESTWSWLEAYGPISADAVAIHGDYWPAATAAVRDALDQIAPAQRLDEALADAMTWADARPVERLHTGSGWGALERHRRAAAGDSSLELPGTPFGDDTLGREQSSWLALVEQGEMAAPAPSLAPASYQVGSAWLALLTAAPQNWFTLLHRGVALCHAGDLAGARLAWTESVEAAVNPWALRNLAVLDRWAGDHASAVQRLRAAHAIVPLLPTLAIELAEALLATGEPAETLGFIDRLRPQLRQHGRIRMLEGRAAVAAGRLDRAARIVDTGIVVDDLREGEDSLDDLWFSYHERLAALTDPTATADTLRERVRRENPLPCLYDFRMTDR
jgi:tetratricopeptide (TPR) repeat protein